MAYVNNSLRKSHTAVSVVFPWSTWPMVPMFKWGSDRSKAVARPRFQTELLTFGARTHERGTAEVRVASREALRRKDVALLNTDIPLYQSRSQQGAAMALVSMFDDNQRRLGNSKTLETFRCPEIPPRTARAALPNVRQKTLRSIWVIRSDGDFPWRADIIFIINY